MRPLDTSTYWFLKTRKYAKSAVNRSQNNCEIMSQTSVVITATREWPQDTTFWASELFWHLRRPPSSCESLSRFNWTLHNSVNSFEVWPSLDMQKTNIASKCCKLTFSLVVISKQSVSSPFALQSSTVKQWQLPARMDSPQLLHRKLPAKKTTLACSWQHQRWPVKVGSDFGICFFK